MGSSIRYLFPKYSYLIRNKELIVKFKNTDTPISVNIFAMVSLHEFKSWDPFERYDSVAAIDSRFAPLLPRNLFIKRTAWFTLCTRIGVLWGWAGSYTEEKRRW